MYAVILDTIWNIPDPDFCATAAVLQCYVVLQSENSNYPLMMIVIAFLRSNHTSQI